MTAETSPTSRALQVLELLQNQPGTTADQLAGALRVTERAARRYVAILREAGIPILSARGRYGGYAVGRGVRLPPLVFSATEALGIVMAVLAGHPDAAESGDPVADALRKIMRALPEAVAAQAELVRRTARPAPDRHAAPADPAITAQLVHASSLHRVVRLGYRGEDGREWTSEAEPWAVVVRQGRWYLVARRTSNQQLRTYRLDRVRTVTVQEQEFEPPADLDPVAVLEENFATGWELGVEVVISAPVERARHWLSRTVGRLEPIDAASCRLVGSTSNPEWYAEVLAAIPVPFRVVEGAEVRTAVRALAARLRKAAG